MTTQSAGILHLYTAHLSAFEYKQEPDSLGQNLIIFIGGLFDGFGTISYISSISDSLARSWSLAQIILSSSYKGWGISSLQMDVSEISRCVEYFRSIKKGLIILMGHSTGCQDIMEYLTGSGHQTRSYIDGAIIQAPVSDREAILMNLDFGVYTQSCLDAQSMVDAGHGDDILPHIKDIQKLFPCPISAYRWLSLASPNKNGHDDYFSSDLTKEQLKRSFGKLPKRTPLCILISGADEFMSENIDKVDLLSRWASIIKEGKGNYDQNHSGVLEGATHNLSNNQKDIIDDLVKRVIGFLDYLQV